MEPDGIAESRVTPTRYSTTAIVLHWLIALALAFQISLGWTLEGPLGPTLFTRFQLHKSVGIAILVLSLIRLAVRLTVPRPMPSDGPAWARRLAEAVHWAFYAVMIGAPLSGWVLVSTAKIKVPTLLFGVVPLPHLPVSSGLHEPADVAHHLLVFVAIGLFVLHVVGALRHQWLLGKPELQRMIPFARGRGVVATLAAFALIGTGMAVGKLVSPDKATTAKAAAAPPAATAPSPAPETAPAPAVETEAGNTLAVANDAEPEPLASWTTAPGGRVGFTASWNGEAVKGNFKAWRAAIKFSPDLLDESRISATIDLASADTGDSQRDDTLKGSDFFDTGLHPRATFTSQRIAHVGGDRYTAAGTLDLHGVKRPVTLRFTLKIDGDTAKVTGTTRIDRTAFGVGAGEWASTSAIAGDVGIDLSFTATRPKS